MVGAFLWGLLGGSALVLGALVAMFCRIGRPALGLVMAFGAGVLISAVAFDLVEEAFTTSAGGTGVGWGLAAGALAFFVGDAVIDRFGGARRKSSTGEQADGNGLAIALGAVLDGVPESLVLGVGLLDGEGVSVAFIVAVFLSNLPEGLAASTGLLRSGWRRSRVLALWTAVALVSGLSALAGYTLFDGAAPSTIAFVLAFAGGAILTMLADTMIPEAYADEGRFVGVVTTAGFALAFFLHTAG